MITPGSRCKITKPSEYFANKYGESTPEIEIEDKDVVVWGGRSWTEMIGNPTAMLYGVRSGFEQLPKSGNVYYGKIHGMGELVHESEIEPMEETNA